MAELRSSPIQISDIPQTAAAADLGAGGGDGGGGGGGGMEAHASVHAGCTLQNNKPPKKGFP